MPTLALCIRIFGPILDTKKIIMTEIKLMKKYNKTREFGNPVHAKVGDVVVVEPRYPWE